MTDWARGVFWALAGSPGQLLTKRDFLGLFLENRFYLLLTLLLDSTYTSSFAYFQRSLHPTMKVTVQLITANEN